jgi:F-type H+-transporting ATPase subunit gamma
MELVAAAKMRKASEATLTSRPYVRRASEVVFDIIKRPVEEMTHPLIADREVKHVLVFAIASDRGLAGAYNANVGKAILQFLKMQKEAGVEVSFITMGKNSQKMLRKAGVSILQSYPHTPNHPTTTDLVPISSFMIENFLNGRFDEVRVAYTDFKSLLSQEVKLLKLLPLSPHKPENPLDDTRHFVYEPTVAKVLETVLPRLLEAELYQCLQEALASEHASRRMAMKSATDNASDMIDDLTLTYNGVRQGSITQELAEITGGAAALNA